jgi:hypothetical protein
VPKPKTSMATGIKGELSNRNTCDSICTRNVYV